MNPRIEILSGKKLVGDRVKMNFIVNKTGDLWRNFMPRRKNIRNIVGSELYSVEVYPATFFNHFNPNDEFEKWAAVEVGDDNYIPDDMEKLVIPEGLYAVFIHKGSASKGPETYNYIFKKWLPESGFKIDNRPHLAIMGDKYKNDDPDSEEEIWIPINRK